MNTVNSTGVSFRSTIIPINSKKPLIEYMDKLKNCNLKSMNNMSIENCYRKLFDEAKNSKQYYTGVMLGKDENGNAIMRFIGHSKENDEFVFKQIKKFDRDARYTKDTIDDGFEHGSFEILI